MPYSAEGYEERAAECVVLANLARDPMVQAELLKLRQTYLQVAQRLRQLEVKKNDGNEKPGQAPG